MSLGRKQLFAAPRRKEVGPWVALLDATLTGDGVLSPEEVREAGVTELNPRRQLWQNFANHTNDGGTIDHVEGIFVVPLQKGVVHFVPMIA